MAEQKPLPALIRLRAERILEYPLVACYRLDPNDQNVVKCVKQDGGVKYVNLQTGKEVPASTLKILIEPYGEEDTASLIGKEAELLSPANLFPADDEPLIISEELEVKPKRASSPKAKKEKSIPKSLKPKK